MSIRTRLRAAGLTVAIAGITAFAGSASAANLQISDAPLFLQEAVAPLNLLVVGRDHKLYYEAYNDASDLDGDGKIDVGYKGYLAKNAGGIDYYGYFDSYKCYTYSTNSNRFNPTRETDNKVCGGTDEWSGDYLNYLTTSRIDALRKVLYGGYRSTDTSSLTVLERAHIPMDAHSWGKEYTSVAVNGYDIRDYTPFAAPTSGRHLFANTTPNDQDSQWYNNNRSPRLRILLNSPYRIWEWVSKESPVAGTQVAPASGTVNVSFNYDLIVRVAACVSGLIGKESCQSYPNGNYKPIGLLHEFGENDSMLFGLLTGSYTANKSGGVLRKNIGSIKDEINANDGTFRNVNGIIKTLDRLRVAGYTRYTNNGGTNYDCGLPAMAHGAPQDGSCRMWGNPVAEMMYEGLRYFRGMSPTPAFTAIYGSTNTDIESSTRLNLPRPNWQDPYKDRPVCTRPFQTVMADINNSYDTDQLPGTVFPLETGSNAISDPLPGLNVATLADYITSYEPDVPGLRFIGQSGTGADSYDGAPTPKMVTSLSNIRGLAPEEPTKQGGYYAASVAYHGLTNDMSPTAAGDQKVQTFAVALASPLPKIEIPVGNHTVTLVPFAKSVRYNNEINASAGAFQPTNQIVDFYVESLADDRTSGSFQVNFEDVEAGNDHDMDAIVRYSYQVTGNTVRVDVSSDYQAGGVIHHLGYVISGTDADGVYLVVQDCNKNSNGTYSCNGSSDPDYFLDTPPGQGPGGTWKDNQPLPGFSSRTFNVGTGATATLLKDPLWYAAKWGGFNDLNKNDRPDLTEEWDQNGDGTPDNYFLVTNALTLSEQLRAAFDEIIARNASASSASVNSGSVSSDTRIYQAKFNSGTWTGQLLSYPVKADGSLGNAEWDAATKIPSADTRKIVTVNSNGTPVPFRWASLDNTRKAQIEPTYASDEALATSRLDYLRGDASKEQRNGGTFRDRPSRLGDIVASSPLFVGAPFFSYGDSLESKPYSAFRTANKDRTPVVYAGANDGMLHAFNGETGVEMLAFVPSAAFRNLRTLSNPSYSHKYFVDAAPNMRDVYFNDKWHTVLVGGLNRGGQQIYALDITDPSKFSEENAASLVLWEFSDRDGASAGITGDRDLGYTYSQPAIVRLHTGRWAAIFGNGYNNTENDGSASTTGNAVLYIVDIETGKLIRKIDTLEGMDDDPLGQGRPNGLATPAAVDIDGDRIADYVYAGDLFGNMWKFDIRHKTDVTKWKVAYGTDAAPAPLFTAERAIDESNASSPKLPQPITSRPEVVRGPRGVGMMVLFGTGKYFETIDKIVDPDAPQVQTYYGIWDRNTNTADDIVPNRQALLKQEILLEDKITFGSQAFNIRATSDKELVAQDGWYLDLLSPNGYEGERQVSNTTVRGSRVIFTTLIPDSDPCNFGGRSWLMELNALDGSRLDVAPFDLNNDGKFDGGDMVTVTIDGKQVQVPVTGLQPDVGISPEPGILFAEGAVREFIYSPGTTGDINLTVGSTDPRARGRQSWRQIK